MVKILITLSLLLNGILYCEDHSYWNEIIVKKASLQLKKKTEKRKHKFWMVSPKEDFKKASLPEETEKYSYYRPNQHIDHTAHKDEKYSDQRLRLQYKKRHRFRVFQPRLAKLSGYQTTLANRVSYTQWKEHNLLSYYDTTFAQFSQKKPFQQNKLNQFIFSFGVQKYLSKRLFIQPEIGVKTLIPNANIKENTKKAFGQEYDPKLQSYLQLTLSYQILKKLPLVNRPLRLNGSYTFTKDYTYPVQDLLYIKSDQGLSFGASIQFKI